MAETSSQPRDAPKQINFDSIIVDLALHPEKDVIVSGDIDGDVYVHSYSTQEDNHELMKLTHHKKACRCVRFSPDGNRLFTGSKDKSLSMVDMEQGAISKTIKKAHSCPMYSMYVADENILATGDDEGTLKVWDMRQAKAVMEIKENEDFISDMVLETRKRMLLTTSGDGTLSAFDIRKHKLKLQSELFDSELLSLAIVKNTEKVVVGDGEGALYIFNWGEWGNMSDRFPGHPMSIDTIVPLNDDIVFTGSFDGTVRAVNILPNRFLGVVGQHDEFPVENMSLSHCKSLLASCSHDQSVRFWNVSNVSSETVDTSKKAKKNNKPKMLNKELAKNDFFADLQPEDEAKKDEDDSDDESDDDSDVDSDDENQANGAKDSGMKDDLEDSDKDSDSDDDDDSDGDDNKEGDNDDDTDDDKEDDT